MDNYHGDGGIFDAEHASFFRSLQLAVKEDKEVSRRRVSPAWHRAPTTWKVLMIDYIAVRGTMYIPNPGSRRRGSARSELSDDG